MKRLIAILLLLGFVAILPLSLSAQAPAPTPSDIVAMPFVDGQPYDINGDSIDDIAFGDWLDEVPQVRADIWDTSTSVTYIMWAPEASTPAGELVLWSDTINGMETIPSGCWLINREVSALRAGSESNVGWSIASREHRIDNGFGAQVSSTLLEFPGLTQLPNVVCESLFGF